MPTWARYYWYVWLAWPVILAPAILWLWWRYRELSRHRFGRDWYKDVETLRRCMIVLIEAETDTEDRRGSFHVHQVLKDEDRRQIEVMLGIQSD